MARNDPTDTGGLFIGRRPGTAPVRYRARPNTASARRQRLDAALAVGLLVVEMILCLSLWGPQPLAWLWIASQLQYLTGSIFFAIIAAFGGVLATLLLTLVLAKRVDGAWKLVRRAAGHEQKEGMLNRIFMVSALIVGSAFFVWILALAPRAK